jgi:hypothetical protein
MKNGINWSHTGRAFRAKISVMKKELAVIQLALAVAEHEGEMPISRVYSVEGHNAFKTFQNRIGSAREAIETLAEVGMLYETTNPDSNKKVIRLGNYSLSEDAE